MTKFEVIAVTRASRYHTAGETVAEFNTFEEAEKFFDRHHGKWVVDDDDNCVPLEIEEINE